MSETINQPKTLRHKYLDLILAFTIVVNITPLITNFKITEILGWTITGGTYIIPFSFIAIGLITEVYGSKAAKRIGYLSLASSWLFIFLLQLVNWLPTSGQSNEELYQTIAGTSLRIALAGLVTFLAAMYSRIFLIKFWEKVLHIKSFGLRNYLTLFINEAINQIIFITLAFWGTVSTEIFFQIIWQGYVVLVGVEILAALALPYLATWLKKKEGVTSA
jgi:queuosine precursor transporter